jgi:hypothetical protein
MLLSLLPLFAASIPVLDEITLKSGGKLEGIVTEDGERITVETVAGVISFQRADVVSIDRTKKSKLQMYYEKYNSIKESKNSDDFYQLAKWVKENGLGRFHKELLERTVEIDSNHEFARRQLGYEFYKGRWHTREEIMLDKGFVLFDGKWMTESERELKVMALKKNGYKAPETRQEVIERPQPKEQPKEQPKQVIDLYLYDYAKMSYLWFDHYLYLAPRAYWWWLGAAYPIGVPSYCYSYPQYGGPSLLFTGNSGAWLGSSCNWSRCCR